MPNFDDIDLTDVIMDGDPYGNFEDPGGGGGEGHIYDLTQSSDNTEITLTEDGVNKTTVRAMRTTAEAKALMLEICYPVGSIYISTKNVSPQTFLGGTWKSKSDYVLRGATSGVNFDSDTNDGGADSVTVSSVASHNHTQNSHGHNSNDYTNGYAAHKTSTAGGRSAAFTNVSQGELMVYQQPPSTTATNIANGSNYTVNTLPKYKNVYIWERTA